MTETPRATVVPELLERRSADTPDGVALAVDRGGRLTFHEWEARSRRVAHTLCAAGVQRGHRVALLFGPMQWVEYAVAYLGVIRTGATAVHLYDGMERVEVDRRLTECQVSRVVHADGRSAPEGFAGPATALSALESGADGPLEVRDDRAGEGIHGAARQRDLRPRPGRVQGVHLRRRAARTAGDRDEHQRPVPPRRPGVPGVLAHLRARGRRADGRAGPGAVDRVAGADPVARDPADRGGHPAEVRPVLGAHAGMRVGAVAAGRGADPAGPGPRRPDRDRVLPVGGGAGPH